MASNRIYLQVDFQASNAQQQIDDLNKKIGAIGTTSEQATKQAASGISGFSLSIEQASESVGRFAAALAGLGLAQIARQLLTVGMEMQRLRIGFENVPGGLDVWKQLHDYALLVGADFQAMIRNANELRNAGMGINDITRALKAFQDLAVHSGASQEQLNEAVNALARITAGGFVNFRALQQFRVLGLEPGIAAAKAMGISIQELRHVIGELDAKEFSDFIVHLAVMKSAGEALRRENQLLQSDINRLKTQFADTSETILNELTPNLKELLKILQDITVWAKENPELFNWGLKIAEAAIALGALSKGLGALQGIAKGLGVLGLLGLTPGQFKVALGAFLAEFLLFQKMFNLADEEDEQKRIAAQKIELATRLELIKRYNDTVKQLAQAEKAVTGKEPTKPSFLPDEHSIEEITNRILGMQKLIQEFRKTAGDKIQLHLDDPEGMQRVLEASKNTLDQSVANMRKASMDRIEALIPAFEEAERKILNIHASKTETIAKREQALANERIALWNNVTAQISKGIEEARKEADKSILETARVNRQVAIAQAEAVPDESFAGRKRVADAKRDAFAAELTAELRLKAQSIDDQVYLDKRGTVAAAAFGLVSAQQFFDAVDKIDQAASLKKMALADEYVAKQNKHTLDAIKINNELQIALEKELRERVLAEDLAAIQQRTELLTTYEEAQRDETFRQRVEGLRTVSDLQAQGIRETADRQIAAHEATLAEFARRNADHAASVKEMTAKTAHETYMIELQAQTDLQKNRLDLWRKTDEAIVEEEMRIFDNLKQFFSGFWDALADRSKSVWASMGDFLKKTLTNALKDIVTSRLAGAVMPLFGYPSPTFPEAGRPTLPFFRALTQPPLPQLSVPAAVATVTEGTFKASVETLGTSAISMNNSAANLNIVAANLNTAAVNLNAAAGSIVAASRGAAAVATTGEASREMIDQAGSAVSAAGMGMQTVPAALPFPTGGGSYTPPAFGIPALAGMGGLAPMGVGLPGFAPGMRGSLGLGGSSQMTPGQTLTNILGSFGIGKNVATGAGSSVTWSAATATQKLGAILKSPGMGQLALGLGAMTALSGFQRGGTSGQVQGIAGSTLAGLGLAQAFPALGLTPVGGAALGLGLGVAAAGLQRGGILGLGMSVGGGALAGAMIGGMFGGPAGMLVGAAIGAAVGGIAGLIRLFNPSLDQRIRSEVKRVYGVDISQKSIRDTIAQIVTSKYGGNLSIALYSQDVQDIVRLYALNVGQSQAGLPRPMYGASFAQSQVGGLQMQPVYSGGQLVQNPYQGTTTTQLQNALIQSNTPAIFLQMSPQQANALFAGQVVNVLNNNPGAVAQANTTAAVSGSSRTSQVSALIEPLAVTR